MFTRQFFCQVRTFYQLEVWFIRLAINIKPFAGNNVRIYYTDGASLIIKSTEVDAVDYFRPSPGGGGAWVRES